jgi:hypothetical protein
MNTCRNKCCDTQLGVITIRICRGCQIFIHAEFDDLCAARIGDGGVILILV